MKQKFSELLATFTENVENMIKVLSKPYLSWDVNSLKRSNKPFKSKFLFGYFILSLVITFIVPGVPKKCWRLINNRTKVFCRIFRISSMLHKACPINF